ncbi:WD40 repeat domain-containing protein [Streptomyces rubellomurinus]|uniref:Novel STAND NTPase 1 domain-containing protein n=1 Tax=Streptomyces rubellomurinus (strain ATCC 31215) TaxID=359131 RepID=A0A0F2TDY0_STRR3|nr:WD40 repeat domain-containing protein [Streptomyces rubellomurinus]KJS60500.1 hypothetical protein VM95_20815 [Streptomyces rubellomurinus]
MSLPEPGPDGLRQEAYASGDATVYMAGRDQFIATGVVHVHYGGDGLRRIEPAEEGGDDCPYPGMAAFEAAQAKWFFGREAVLAKLTSRLDECLRGGGAVGVVGASGSGKSSLLRAGLVPALGAGALPGSRRWPCLLFTPGEHPVAALAGHLAALTDSEPAAVEAELADDPPALAARLRAALDRYGADRLVLVVDQAEELFTQVEATAERDRFVDALTQLANGAGAPALVVYGVRADFYGRFAEHPALQAALERRQVFVGPMSDTELAEAVTAPAASVGLTVEPRLVDVLLRDLGVDALAADQPEEEEEADDAEPTRPWRGYDAGRLPLLAHALRATWRARSGTTLTLAGYRASGGIHGAIEATAEDVYRGLDEEGRRAAETILRNLVRINEDAEDTRRALPADRATEGVAPDVAEAVLAAFTEGRLLTRNRTTVQITHEALLKAWPRLRGWLETDRTDHLVRQQLKDAAAEWEDKRHDRSLLYRGNRLQAARDATDRTGGDPGSTVAAFLDAAIRLKRRTAALRRGAVALLVVLAVIALASAKLAGDQKDRADQQRRVAVEQADLATERLIQAKADTLRESDPQLSLRLSLAALRLHPTPEARSGMLRTLEETHLEGSSARGAVGSGVNLAAFTGDGGMLAVVPDHERGTVNLWDTAELGQPLQLASLRSESTSIEAVAFSSDQRRLVTVGRQVEKRSPSDVDVALWDLTDRHRPRRLPFHADPGVRVRGAAISPDGRTLALVADEPTTTLALWDIANGDTPRRLGSPVPAVQAEHVIFSSDGRLLITGAGSIEYQGDALTSSSIVRGTGWQVWDVADPAAPKATAAHGPWSGQFALSPTAPLLAENRDRTVTLWDLADPRTPSKRSTLTTAADVSAFAFGPDGRSLVTSTSNGGSVLWDITDPANPRSRAELVGSHGAAPGSGGKDLGTTYARSFDRIQSVAYNGTGGRIVLAAADGTLSQWSIDGRPLPARTATLPRTNLAAAAYSVDGNRLLTGEWSGDARIWDTSDPARPRESTVLPGKADWPAVAVAFNRDATVVAVGTRYGESARQGEVVLWDVSTPAAPRRTATLQLPSGVGSMAFSPTSDLLVVTGGRFFEDTWVGFWNTRAPDPPRQLKLIDRLGVAVSDATKKAHPDRTPPAFDFDPQLLMVHEPTVFGPDGRRLVLPSSLWDVSDPAAPVLVPVVQPAGPAPAAARPFSGPGGAAFSPDGRLLAEGSGDGVKLWPLGAGIGPSATGLLPVTPSTHEAHIDYHPGGNLVAVGQDNGLVRLYEVADPALPGLAVDLPDSAADVQAVRFSPDKKTLLVLRTDGTAQIWDLGALPAIAADPVGLACRIAAGGLSRKDWEGGYAAGLPYQDTCARS